MNNQDYEQKKRKCFVQFCKDNGIDQEVNISIFDAFDQIFDRAYALGKQFGNSEQVDAEDILCVSREKVKEAFDTAKKIATSKMSSKMLSGAADMVCKTLDILFGSKCLPDEEQIAENANCSNVDSLSQNPPENCNKANHISTDDSKPAEPTDFGREVNFPTKKQSRNFSQETANCDNRLQIAAMAMQGILSNIDLFKNVLETGTETLSGDGFSYQAVAKASLLFADALIAEERS